MSILVRAAIFGGLAYVISRAVKTDRISRQLPHPDSPRLAREREPDEVWADQDRIGDQRVG